MISRGILIVLLVGLAALAESKKGKGGKKGGGGYFGDVKCSPEAEPQWDVKLNSGDSLDKESNEAKVRNLDLENSLSRIFFPLQFLRNFSLTELSRRRITSRPIRSAPKRRPRPWPPSR